MKNGYHYCLGQRFVEAAQDSPDNIALRLLDDQEMSYRDLDILSNRLAHYLIGLGIERGDVVGLFHDKSFTGYGVMLACLKIGALYVNLDPDSPQRRLVNILAVCHPEIILAGACWPEKDEFLAECPVCFFDRPNFLEDLRSYPESPPEMMAAVDGASPAYLMFTSGSTGFPKGVVIPHSAVINFIDWSRTAFRISTEDVFTGINPMFFDNSVFDFYASLFNGATLVPIPQSLARRPKQMVEEVGRHGCTVWFSVPSMLVFVLRMRALTEDDLAAVRMVVFGGEGFPKTALRQLHGLLGDRVEFVNVYGPTECTCICAAYGVSDADVRAGGLLPLGRIAPNFSYRILDGQDRPVADGETGEFCLLGPQLALGYYHNPLQTQEFFVKDPLQASYVRLMYRTGDFVYHDDLGLLRFVGRKDNQIKRMGYRIELEEIDVALGSLVGVHEAVSVFIKTDDDDRGRIVAWVAGPTGEAAAEIEQGVRDLLPSYMVPDQLKFYSALPKNENGKVDRKAVLAAEMEALEL